MRTAIIACSARKLPGLHYASHLYQGDLFKKCQRLALNTCDRYFILSAKHGLIHPDTMVESYDTFLGDYDTHYRCEWGACAARQLQRETTRFGETLVWLAAESYTGLVRPHMEKAGYELHEQPLYGMGIGQQLGWLKRQLAA